MSEARVEAYMREVFAPEDSTLIKIRKRHVERGLPEIYVSPEQGRLLQVLVRLAGARRILEVGSLAGYSGVWLARALPSDGELVTVEVDPARARATGEAFAEAGLERLARVVVGDAREVLARLEGPFDVVFLDADKEHMPNYFDEAMRLLPVGGLLLADNAFFHGSVADPDDQSPAAVGMRTYNRLASSDARLSTAVVPIRDGLVVSVRIAE